MTRTTKPTTPERLADLRKSAEWIVGEGAGGATEFALERWQEILRLLDDIDDAHRAMRACIKDHYVGDGQVICADSLKPHIDRFVELLATTKVRGVGNE